MRFVQLLTKEDYWFILLTKDDTNLMLKASYSTSKTLSKFDKERIGALITLLLIMSKLFFAKHSVIGVKIGLNPLIN